MHIRCDAISEQLQYLRCTLLRFEVVSGMRINLGKSKMAPVGDCNHMDELADIVGCEIPALPTKYMGFTTRSLL